MFGNSNDWSSVEYLSSNYARPSIIDSSRVIRTQGSRPSSYAGSYGETFERPSGFWIPKYIGAGATDESISKETGGKVKYMVSGLLNPLIDAAISQLKENTSLQQNLTSPEYQKFKAKFEPNDDFPSISSWFEARGLKTFGFFSTNDAPLTKNRIKVLQAVHGASIDGTIGPETYKKLGIPKPYGKPAPKKSKSSSGSDSNVAPSKKFYQKTWVKVVGGVAFVGILAAILFVPKKD